MTTHSADKEQCDTAEDVAPQPETRRGAQPGETVCPGCIHGPACRVIPCSTCGKSWHLLGMIDNPFVCWLCEDTRVTSPDAPHFRATKRGDA